MHLDTGISHAPDDMQEFTVILRVSWKFEISQVKDHLIPILLPWVVTSSTRPGSPMCHTG